METSSLTKNRRKNKSPAKKSSQNSISDLPEVILLHILSFLPTPDAIRTTAVAPPWRNLWKALPNFDFDVLYFQKQIPGKSHRLACLLFAEFVTQALRCLGKFSPLRKFKLLFFYKNYEHIQGYVNSWIYMLVQLGKVAEIDLDFVQYDEEDEVGDSFHFNLACTVLYNSIEVLKLRNCALIFPSAKIISVKELHLGYFQGEPDDIEQLMDYCISLETFSLEYYECEESFKIVSKSLRHLTLVVTSSDKISVQICSPSLESIKFGRIHSNVVYNFRDVSSLVEASVDFEALDDTTLDWRAFEWSWLDLASWVHVVSSLTHVERLSIHNIPQDEYCLLGSKRGSRAQMSFAETWYLEADILSLEALLEKCPKLETMVLVRGSDSREDGELEEDETASNLNVNIALQIPCLREVKMEGYLGTKNEQYVVDHLLKKHGVVLEKIVAFPAKVGHILL